MTDIWRDLHGVPVGIPGAFGEARDLADAASDIADLIQALVTGKHQNSRLTVELPGVAPAGYPTTFLTGPQDRGVALRLIQGHLRQINALSARLRAYAVRLEMETADFELPKGFQPLEPRAFPKLSRRAVP